MLLFITVVEASVSYFSLGGIVFMLIGVLHFAMRSFGKFMKVLYVIVFATFLRLRVFVAFVLGVVELTALESLGTSP